MLALLLLGFGNVLETVVYPLAVLIVGTLIVTVVTTILGKRSDERKKALEKLDDERKREAAAIAEERRQKDALVELLKVRVEEMHGALLGHGASDWMPATPGLVKQVARIEGTLFGNGGVHNTVLDRLQRIENGRLPAEEDTDRPDEHTGRKPS